MIHVGNDGWLFLTKGANDVLRYYATEDHFSDADCARWSKLIDERGRRARELGAAEYLHVIAPDKLSLYPEYFRDALPFAWRAPSRLVPQRRGPQRDFVDALAVLEQEKGPGRLLYWKTDSHWSFAGAFAVYAAICRRLGVEAVHEIRAYPFKTVELALDLGGKLDPPVLEPLEIHNCCKNAHRIHANEIVTQAERVSVLHQGAYVVFENQAPRDGRTVFLIGDSYSEYRETLLTGMLAETFARVHFLWHANVDWKLVARAAPDIVISQIAERFMNVVPNDDLDLDAFVAMRLARQAH